MSGPNNDAIRMQQSLDSVARYVFGYRHIYVVSPINPLGLPLVNDTTVSSRLCTTTTTTTTAPTPLLHHNKINKHEIVWVPDSFLLEKMLTHFDYQQTWESNWHKQQLMKLHAAIVLPNMLNTALVMDAELIFHKRVTHTVLYDGQVAAFFNFGRGLVSVVVD